MSIFRLQIVASRRSLGRLARSVAAVFAVSAVLAAPHALAAPGQIDTTFGPYGTGWGESIGQLYNFVALDGLVLPDDRIVVGGACPSHGTSPVAGTVFCVAVWSAMGGNAIQYPVYLNGAMNRVSSGALGGIARQRDGKIVLTAPCQATVSSPSTLCVMRFTTNFAIDTTFAVAFSDRVAKTSWFTGNSFSSAVAIQPDGKIIIAGQCGIATGTVMCVARFGTNGELDTAFGSGGDNLRTLPGVASAPFDRAKSVVVLPSGKIMLGGDCKNTNSYVYPCAARLNEDGSIDASFNTGSSAPRILPGIGAGDDYINDMKMQGNGEMVLAGHCNNSSSAQRVPCASRVQQDGTQGTTFSGAAVPTTGARLIEPDSAGSFRIDRVLFQADGKFLVAMFDYSSVAGQANRTTRIRRYNEDGSIDGNWQEPSIQYQYNSGWTVALGQQSNSKVIMMGSTDGAVRIARLDNRPSAGRNCSMDIDGDGKVLPTTDGLLLARVSAGMTGNAVISDAIGVGAVRPTWALLRDYLVTQCGMTTVAP